MSNMDYIQYKGYQYFFGIDSDGDAIKIWHQAEKENGELIDIDYDPYENMSFDTFIKLVEMGFPKRTDAAPLNQKIVNNLYREWQKEHA